MGHIRALKKLKAAMKRMGVSCLVLYGSTARGENEGAEDVDVDLGVLFKKPPTPSDEQKILDVLTELFPEDILDIAVLNHTSPLLNFHIARDGKALFEDKKGDFMRFRIKALRQYWDTGRFRKLRETFALR